MKCNILVFLVFYLLFSSFLHASQSEIDSLRLVYKNSNNLEEKISILSRLCQRTKYSDFNNSLIYGRVGINLAKKNDDLRSEAEIRNSLGLGYMENTEYDKSLKEYTVVETIYKELEDEEMIGVIYNNFGLLYSRQNNYAKELEYHHKALDIFLEKDLPSRKAMSFINIGKVYIAKKDYKTAGDYFVKSYKIYESLSDSSRMITSLNNIAATYLYAGDKKLSNIYFDKNLELINSMKGFDRQKAMILYNSASVLMDLDKMDEAESRLLEALVLCKKLNDKVSLAICHHNIGALHIKRKKFNEARDHFQVSLELSIVKNMKQLEIQNYKYLAQVYEGMEDYEKAHKNYKYYFSIKDTIFNEQIEKINEVEKKYLEEKSAREIELLNIQKKEGEHRANQVKLIGAGSIVILLIVIVSIFSKYKDKKKTSLILSQKNKEITDSIQYAKRIQKAILPPLSLVKELLPNSFIFYKPKDIVAGDFYWLEKKDGKILFAAADCTGHGVPGAMVSVICNNGLNRSVREYGLTDPGQILDKTREIVISEFEKSEEEVKDGMDIALCSIHKNNLQYAGAHNPLWIVREDELMEIKANKQPIGKYDSLEQYTTHDLELKSGDSIYIFSDGFHDQFGGEKGKKLKTSNFKKLILSIQKEKMKDQKILLDEAFDNWRGELEQLDDVCVIGVKI